MYLSLGIGLISQNHLYQSIGYTAITKLAKNILNIKAQSDATDSGYAG